MADIDEILKQDEENHHKSKINDSIVDRDEKSTSSTSTSESDNSEKGKVKKDGVTYSVTSTNLELEAFADSTKLKDSENIKGYDHMKNNLSTVKESSESSSSSTSSESETTTRTKKDDLSELMKNKDKTEEQKTGFGSMLRNDKYEVKHSSNSEGLTDENGNPLTEEEVELLKLDMMRKLGELTTYGVKLTDNYSMKSPYKKMKYEYELHIGVRKKKNSVHFMRSSMLNLVFGLELFSSSSMNPFDVDLQGWSKVMNSEIDNYYDVFGEIYEKYNKPGKDTDPLIKLVFMVGASALQFSLSKNMMGMLPGMNNGLQNDPQKQARLRQMAIDARVNAANKEKEAINKYMDGQHKNVESKLRNINLLRQKEQEHMNGMNMKPQQKLDIPNLDEMEKALEQASASTEQASKFKPKQQTMKLPPALQRKMAQKNQAMQERLMKENILRQQMMQTAQNNVNPQMLSPQQQAQMRQQQIAMQNLEMINREKLRQDMAYKKTQEEMLKKIDNEYSERNAEERSKGTISDNLEEKLSSFYKNKKKDKKSSGNDDTDTSTSSGEKGSSYYRRKNRVRTK